MAACLKDKLGKDICLGDFIIYGTRYLDTWELLLGIVIGLPKGGGLEVRGIRREKLNSRTGVIPQANKVIVIPDSMVPAGYFALFEKG